MPLKKPESKIEAEIFEVWKQWKPSAAYMGGVADCAGKLFVPTEEDIGKLLKRIKALKKQAEDVVQQKYLRCIETTIGFEEPYMAVDDALWTFFAHLVKEGVKTRNMLSLTNDTAEALKVSKKRLAKKKWSTEIRIVTCNECNGLIGILETIKNEAKDAKLKSSIDKLVKTVEDYRKTFYVEGIKEGDFSEIFPILEKHGGNIGRKHVYPKILRDMYDYPETTDEIEAKGLRWLKEELPHLKEVTAALAKIYGIEPTIEKVSAEITKRRNVDKAKVVKFITDAREILRKVVEKHLVKITPKYGTRVMETPSYLVNFISTAAMNNFDILTDKPFNVFFVTTDPKRAPPSGAPDLLQTLVHEEYGHCVNFSNSSVGFAAKPRLVELLDTRLHLPISDGISFYREYEFLMLLKKLRAAKGLSGAEKDFMGLLRSMGNLDQVILENEFVLTTWRIIRFLRAIGDVRINMHKQTIVEFVNWASKETDLSKKMIFNQIFIFQDRPGYAPCYSIAGDALRKIQETAAKKGKSIVDFNTYACSLGFPPRTIFEQKLNRFAKA